MSHMGACGSRSLSLLAATVLLSVGQLSPATAASISLSPDTIDFGNVTVGEFSNFQQATATFTPDPGFVPLGWGLEFVPPPFHVATPCGESASFTCAADLFFGPTTSGDFSLGALFVATEFDPVTNVEGPPTTAFLALDGTGVAAANTPIPTTLPLFATGLGALGLLGWFRKRKARVSLLGVT
jgi:hypothetical protein